jgi:hypothetical protein
MYVIVNGEKGFQSEYLGEFPEPSITLGLELLKPKQSITLDIEQIEVVPGQEQCEIIARRDNIVEDETRVEFRADKLFGAGVDGLVLLRGFNVGEVQKKLEGLKGNRWSVG